jgi:hypothetical protein
MQRIEALANSPKSLQQELTECVSSITLDGRKAAAFQALIPLIMRLTDQDPLLMRVIDDLKSITNPTSRWQRPESFIYTSIIPFLSENERKQLPVLAHSWKKDPRSALQQQLLANCMINNSDSDNVRTLKKYMSYILLEKTEAAAFSRLTGSILSLQNAEFKIRILNILKPFAALLPSPASPCWQRPLRFICDSITPFLSVREQLLTVQQLGRAWRNQTKIPYGILDFTDLYDKQEILALLEKYGRKTSRPELVTKMVFPVSLASEEMKTYLAPYRGVTSMTLSPTDHSLREQFIEIGRICPSVKHLSFVRTQGEEVLSAEQQDGELLFVVGQQDKGLLDETFFMDVEERTKNSDEKGVKILHDLTEFKMKVKYKTVIKEDYDTEVGEIESGLLNQMSVLSQSIKKLEMSIFFQNHGELWFDSMKRMKITSAFFNELSKKEELTFISFSSNVNIDFNYEFEFPPHLTCLILDELDHDLFEPEGFHFGESDDEDDRAYCNRIEQYYRIAGMTMDSDNLEYLMNKIINHAHKLEELQLKGIRLYTYDKEMLPILIDRIDFVWKLDKNNPQQSRIELIDRLRELNVSSQEKNKVNRVKGSDDSDSDDSNADVEEVPRSLSPGR